MMTRPRRYPAGERTATQCTASLLRGTRSAQRHRRKSIGGGRQNMPADVVGRLCEPRAWRMPSSLNPVRSTLLFVRQSEVADPRLLSEAAERPSPTDRPSATETTVEGLGGTSCSHPVAVHARQACHMELQRRSWCSLRPLRPTLLSTDRVAAADWRRPSVMQPRSRWMTEDRHQHSRRETTAGLANLVTNGMCVNSAATPTQTKS